MLNPHTPPTTAPTPPPDTALTATLMLTRQSLHGPGLSTATAWLLVAKMQLTRAGRAFSPRLEAVLDALRDALTGDRAAVPFARLVDLFDAAFPDLAEAICPLPDKHASAILNEYCWAYDDVNTAWQQALAIERATVNVSPDSATETSATQSTRVLYLLDQAGASPSGLTRPQLPTRPNQSTPRGGDRR